MLVPIIFRFSSTLHSRDQPSQPDSQAHPPSQSFQIGLRDRPTLLQANRSETTLKPKGLYQPSRLRPQNWTHAAC